MATVARNLKLWDLDTKRRRFSTFLFSNPGNLDFSPDGSEIVVKNTAGKITQVNARNGEMISTFDQEDISSSGTDVFFPWRGRQVVDASDKPGKGVLRVHSLPNWTLTYEELHDNALVRNLSSSLDRTLFLYTVSPVATTDTDPPQPDFVFLHKWPFERNSRRVLQRRWEWIVAASLSPSGSRAVILHGAPPKTLELVELARETTVARSEVLLGGAASSVSWSPDESMVGCVEAGFVTIFDSSTLTRRHSIKLKHQSCVRFAEHMPFVGLGSWQEGLAMPISSLADHPPVDVDELKKSAKNPRAAWVDFVGSLSQTRKT